MEKDLEQYFREISETILRWSGSEHTQFIVRCRPSIKDIIGDSFEIDDYIYEVIAAEELIETENIDGSFSSDIWIIPK